MSFDHDRQCFVDDAFSSDEADAGAGTRLGRVARKALDREIPWRLITDKSDIAKFVDAMKRHWADWMRWGVARLVPAGRAKGVPREQRLQGRSCL